MFEAARIFDYRDWLAEREVHAHTYPYGGGIPEHGIQLTITPAGGPVRLPAEHARALARAILATYPGDGTESTTDPLVTPTEVARLFGVDPKTVSRWAQAGRLRAVRTPGGHRRFRRSEVARLAAGGGPP